MDLLCLKVHTQGHMTTATLADAVHTERTVFKSQRVKSSATPTRPTQLDVSVFERQPAEAIGDRPTTTDSDQALIWL